MQRYYAKPPTTEKKVDRPRPPLNIGYLDLRLPSRKILNDPSLARTERSLREPLFGRKSSQKQKQQTSKQKGSGINVAGLRKAVESAAGETANESSMSSLKVDKTKKDWHEIPERQLTPEEERDARLIENRQYLDPKRFYKSSGTGRKRGELPNRVQFGTVIVGAHEFYSARLTRKERKSRIIDEVLADERVMGYTRQRNRALHFSRSNSKRIVDPSVHKRRRNR